MYVHVCVWCPLKLVEEDTDPLELELWIGGEPPYRCWDSNQCPLQEQQELLSAELSLQP